jgi:zinc protease
MMNPALRRGAVLASAFLSFSAILALPCRADITSDVWPQSLSDIPADQAVTWGVLPNGVRYAVMEHSEPPKRVSLRLYMRSGSLMEKENQRGVAHFFEHMAFNGTTHYPSGEEMVRFFQRLGMDFGGDTNAYTGFDKTVFQLELPNTEDALMNDSMTLLRDYADGVLLDDKEIDAERGVILSEKRSRDTVKYRLMVDSLEFSLPDSIVPKRMPIGLEPVISSAKQIDFLSYYKTWYTPDRMTVVIVGDINPSRAARYIEKYFSDIAVTAPKHDPDLGTINSRGAVAKVFKESEADAVDISIANIRRLIPVIDTISQRGHDIAADVANAIINRRLQILSKKDGAPFSNGEACSYRWLNFVDDSEIDLTCPPDKWKEALGVADTEIRKALTYGFTRAELAEAVANLKNEYEEEVKQAASRKSSDIAEKLIDCLSDENVFSSPEKNLEIASKILDSLKPESVLEALRHEWRGDTRIICVCGNLPADADDAQALSVYNENLEKGILPPEETKIEAFAYRDFSKTAKVANASFSTDLGITQIEYDNNVFVNIKPTDFEKNVIKIAIRFGNGLLGAPADKPGLQMFANMTFIEGGLVAHSADDIARIFAGKNVQASFFVDTDAFVLLGTTSPRDFEDELDLLAAYLVYPGYRDEALRQARMAVPQLYAQLEHTSEGVMGNEMQTFLSCGDYRFGYPSQDKMLSYTMDDLKSWMADSLTTSRLEISIVGDFDLEQIKPIVARTFGSLPMRLATKPDMIDKRVVNMQKGVSRTFEYVSGIPKAISVFAWPTADQWDISRTRRLTVLSSIISDRLRVQLREKLGEAYSPYAQSSVSDTFKDYGYMLCRSEVSPDKIVKVADIVREVGDDLSRNGVTQDELDRALKPMFEQIIQWRRNNMYWLMSVMASSHEYPVRLEWARSMVTDLHSITVDDINKLASTYLKSGNAVDIRIVPARQNSENKADK